MIPPIFKRALFFVTLVCLMGACFYFAWAWSRVTKDNAALRQQISVLAAGYKKTEEAVSRVREREQSGESARAVSLKDQKNLKAGYIRVLLQSQKVAQENAVLKARAEQAEKARDAARRDAAAARTGTGDKDQEIASLNERLGRLIVESKKLENENDKLNDELKKIRSEQEMSPPEVPVARPTLQVADLHAEIWNLKKENGELADAVRDSEKEARNLKKSAKSLDALKETNKKYEMALKGAQKETMDLKYSKEKIGRLEKEAAVAHYNIGVLYVQQHRYEEAAREFENALAINPEDALAHYNLATLQDVHLHDTPEALKHYEAYVRYSPKADDLQQVQYRIFTMRLEVEKGLGNEFRNQK